MKAFLLIMASAFALLSCKGADNKTAPVQFVSAYEKKPFLVIGHNEDSSVLRTKLLHLKFYTLMNVAPEFKIKSDDQFKLGKETFERSAGEQIEYEKLQQNSAEVVVSYSDREEIYFVPTGILRDQAFGDLGLKPESEKNLEWAPGTPSVLSQKSIYYLLSSSREELIENDRKLFFSKTDPSSETQKSFSFSPNQKVVIHFTLEYFLKETTVELISGGPPGVCKSDMREAGFCEPCKAKIEKTTGRLSKVQGALHDLGLVLLLNGKEISLAELSPVFSEEGKSIEVELDIRKVATDKVVTLQLVSPRIVSQVKTVSSFGFEGHCRSRSVQSAVLDLTPEVKMTYQLNIFGKNFSP